jgi:hypothetical protein
MLGTAPTARMSVGMILSSIPINGTQRVQEASMKNFLIIGIVLIGIGAAVLGYDHYSYTTREQVLQIGPLTATAEKTHTVSFPPVLGWLLVGGGACLIAFALIKKN